MIKPTRVDILNLALRNKGLINDEDLKRANTELTIKLNPHMADRINKAAQEQSDKEYIANVSQEAIGVMNQRRHDAERDAVVLANYLIKTFTLLERVGVMLNNPTSYDQHIIRDITHTIVKSSPIAVIVKEMKEKYNVT